jgi:hypothetical protein
LIVSDEEVPGQVFILGDLSIERGDAVVESMSLVVAGLEEQDAVASECKAGSNYTSSRATANYDIFMAGQVDSGDASVRKRNELACLIGKVFKYGGALRIITEHQIGSKRQSTPHGAITTLYLCHIQISCLPSGQETSRSVP